MTIPSEWALGYARQASADFETFEALQILPGIPNCHKLLFLQMACEKLCKAHLIASGSDPKALQSSHGYVAGPLPVVVRQQIVLMFSRLKGTEGIQTATRHLAQEIELLNPAVDRAGDRRDNCEYPWESGGTLRSPLDWSFGPSHLLTERHGRTILKLIKLAIRRLVESSAT
jgi:hypothetical protein